MKYPLCSIRDVSTGFMAPQTEVNEQTAVRNFTFAINNPDTGVMHYQPKDFDLYKIGLFDTDSGNVEVLPVPELLVHGMSVYGVNV